MRFTLALLLAILSFSALAQTPPRLTRVAGHKVFFQSETLKFIQSTELYRGRLITRWGTQVFQVHDAYYACGPRRCKLQETKARAFFTSCKLTATGAACRDRIRPASHVSEGDDYRSPGYWERWADDGDHHRDIGGWYSDSDFPERGHGSDWETGGIVLF